MFKCSNVQMFKCSIIQIFKCWNIQIFKCSNALMLKCSNIPMFNCSNVQMFKCSNFLMFQCSSVQIRRGGWANFFDVLSELFFARKNPFEDIETVWWMCTAKEIQKFPTKYPQRLVHKHITSNKAKGLFSDREQGQGKRSTKYLYPITSAHNLVIFLNHYPVPSIQYS